MQQQNVNRIVVTGQEAKEKLLSGVNQVCDVIGSTMGYRGSNNLFETFDGMPHITKDGFDSLEMMFLSGPIENMGSEIVKEACRKTHSDVGDNTTLTCVLTQAFFQNSLKAVENGKHSIEVSQDILKSVEKVSDYLDKLAIPLTDELMYDIAKTAGNGDDEIAKIVQEAFIKAGEYGTVSHNRSFADETYIDFIDGNPIERGFAHEAYINSQETQSVIFENPLIIVSNFHFRTFEDLKSFVEIAFPENAEGVPFIAPRPLVIISTMEDNVSDVLLANVRQYKFPICVINPPYFGKKGRENLADLALILGCSVLEGISRSDYTGKENTFLGTCDRIEIKEKDSVITLNPDRDKTAEQGVINDLTAQILIQDNIHEKNYLKERIAKISGGIVTIKVGGITPSEIEEKVARIDDSVCAVRSAKDGVLAGGGIALLNAYQLDDIDNTTKESIVAPYIKIMSNAGKTPVSPSGIKKYPIGYDVKEYKEVNMFDAGIIDTLKGVKNALANSASASNNLLRTNFVMPFKRTSDGK